MKISPAVLSILLRGSSAFISSSSSSSGGLGLASSVISPRSRLNNFSSLANNLRGGGSSIINISSSNSVAPSASTTSLTMVAGGDQQPPLRPFNTWTFDKHCESMSWSPPSDIALTATHCSSSSTSAASLEQADLIIVGVFAPAKDDDTKEEDENEEEEEAIVPPIVFSGKAKELDEALGGALSELAAENSKAFQNGSNAGKMTPVARIRGDGGVTRRFALLGLGHESTKKKENVDPKESDAAAAAALVTKAASAVASSCHDQKKANTCHVLLPLSSPLTNNNDEVEGALLQTFSTEFHSNLYSDNRYRTGKKIEVKAEDVKSVKLFLESSSSTSSEDILASSIATGIQIASGISLTRDIVNAPHNVLNSESLAETARRIALESGGSIKCEILEKEECEARGMGAYLGVARGSETEPQFIHLTYKPASGSIK